MEALLFGSFVDAAEFVPQVWVCTGREEDLDYTVGKEWRGVVLLP